MYGRPVTTSRMRPTTHVRGVRYSKWSPCGYAWPSSRNSPSTPTGAASPSGIVPVCRKNRIRSDSCVGSASSSCTSENAVPTVMSISCATVASSTLVPTNSGAMSATRSSMRSVPFPISTPSAVAVTDFVTLASRWRVSGCRPLR